MSPLRVGSVVDVADNSGADSGAASTDPDAGPAHTVTPRRKTSLLREIAVLVVTAIVLSFLVQTFLARTYVIPSQSMEPTLIGCPHCATPDDRIVVDRLTYRFNDPRAGDVVVFKGPDASWNDELPDPASSNPVLLGLQYAGMAAGMASPHEKDFVKRVIATGGQTVRCCSAGGAVEVDGKALIEPYVQNDFPFTPGKLDCTTTPASRRCFASAKIAPGRLWVMGDNRNDSSDSRYHRDDPTDPLGGQVPIGDVRGKARVIILPVSRWGIIHAPEIDRTAGLSK